MAGAYTRAMTFDQLVSKAQEVRKALAAALVPVGTLVAVNLGPDHWLTVALVTVGAFLGVYFTPRNKPRE